MGSNIPSSAGKPDDEVVVFVTGFAPFRVQYPVNPSWEITRALPPLLAPSSEFKTPSIRILIHPSPVKVSYATVRELVPKWWSGVEKIDFMIHVGMAGGRRFYSVERRGHRDRYTMPDVYGVVLGDEKKNFLGGDGEGEDKEDRAEPGKEKEKWVWEGCPEELLTDVDLDDVWVRWRAAMPDVDLRISEDADRYLCDFTYYSSLAHLYKLKEERRVVFLHIPPWSDPESLEKGKGALIALIKSLVRSRDMGKIKGDVEESAVSA